MCAPKKRFGEKKKSFFLPPKKTKEEQEMNSCHGRKSERGARQLLGLSLEPEEGLEEGAVAAWPETQMERLSLGGGAGGGDVSCKTMLGRRR